MRWVAFIDSGDAFSVRGQWLGPFNGSFLDVHGRPILWNDEIEIESELPPLQPLAPLTPLTPILPLRPLNPIVPLGGWSTIPFDRWIRQGR